MKWSIKVGRLFGIDVFIHFTFLLLLGKSEQAEPVPGKHFQHETA